MGNGFEINEYAKEDSWRMFRIIGEMVEGFDKLGGIEPAVTIYGASRMTKEDPVYPKVEEIARRLGELGFNIITGGGPGVMEAANKGALAAGVRSVGLNIQLPNDQVCNSFSNLNVTFNHFFIRKVMLVKYATAFIAMPGGLGTLDELTEVLTLIQTQKIKPFPVVLFYEPYWRGFIAWLKSHSLAQGYITEADLNLLTVTSQVDEVLNTVKTWFVKHEVVGRKAVTQ